MTLLALIFRIALVMATVVFVAHAASAIGADLRGISSHNAAYSIQLDCIRTNSTTC